MLCFYTATGEYYLGFFRRLTAGQLSIILANTISTPVNFTIEIPLVGFYHSDFVNGSDEVTVSLPFSVAVFPNDTQSKGIYIRADRNAIIVIGQNERSGRSDTFLALPYKRSSVITKYVYYGISVPGYSSSYQGAILIVGTEDNTTMKLTVTQTATTNTGNALYTGREYSFVIDRLQTFYVRSTGDLTGTKIVTDKQVSVFSGHELAQVPENICCDSTLVEQIPPVTSWGRVFYTAPLSTRTSYTVKILGSINFTKIDFYCNDIRESRFINEGQYYSKTLSQQESCAIQSTKPVLVTQISHGYKDQSDNIGDPMIMIIPDALQFSNKFTVSTIRNTTQPNYKHYVNIIVLAQYYQPDMILLKSGGSNMSLDTQQWVPINIRRNTEAYATQVTLSEGLTEIEHNNSKALMTVNIYGFASGESYGHPGRLSQIHVTGNIHAANCGTIWILYTL